MSNPFEAPWTSVAPSSWQRTYLGHLVDVRSGATPSKDEPSFWNGEIPWVSPKDMKVLRIADSEDHVSDAALSGSALRWVAKGSVLMVTRGMILNHTVPVALVERPLTINQDMKALVPRGALRGDFLMWLLVGLNPAILARVEEAAHGTKALRTEQWRKLPLAMPPIDIQRRIADFLDRRTASIDTLIAKQEQLLALLAEERQALITQAVTKGLDPNAPMKDSGVEWLGAIPAHWNLSKLGYEVQFFGGATPSKGEPAYWEGGAIPWVSPKDMKELILHRVEDHITERALHESAVKMIEPNAVLVVVRGMILAKTFPVALNAVAVTLNQDMKALRCGSRLLPGFLAWQLRARNNEIEAIVETAAHGTKALRTDLFSAFPLILPPLHEQEAILRHLDVKCRGIDKLVQRVQAMVEKLREYRQALITAAVTGQLDVTTIEVEQAANVVEVATA